MPATADSNDNASQCLADGTLRPCYTHERQDMPFEHLGVTRPGPPWLALLVHDITTTCNMVLLIGMPEQTEPQQIDPCSKV